ncbi:helicase C-terminal domain-containing protein [Fusobacterium varium]
MIRSKTDHGTVTILDNRVINKRYGKYFMDLFQLEILELWENRLS